MREQSEGQISDFIRHWDERGFGLWAAEHRASGVFIGFVGLASQEEWIEDEHKTEVGWRLDRAYWGRGLATASSSRRTRPRGGSPRRRG